MVVSEAPTSRPCLALCSANLLLNLLRSNDESALISPGRHSKSDYSTRIRRAWCLRELQQCTRKYTYGVQDAQNQCIVLSRCIAVKSIHDCPQERATRELRRWSGIRGIQAYVTGNTEHSKGIQHERKVTVIVSMASNEK